MPPFQRPVSPTERLWLIADRVAAPFVNQLVLEGDGALDEPRWQRAVAVAAEANPGARVVLRGALDRARWVDGGAPPRVRTCPAPAWDGRGPGGADFLRDPLPPAAGPTTEVVLAPGAVPRAIVRTHHATMDGRGTLLFVDDVFRCLRGEGPVGAASPVIDADLAARLLPAPARRRAEDCLAPTGAADASKRGITWRRLTVRGPVAHVVGGAAVAIARAARRHAAGTVRVDVPVDLRPHAGDARSTANLTGMVHLDVAPDDDAAAVGAALRAALDRHDEAAFVQSFGVVRWVPLWAGEGIGRAAVPRLYRRGRYITSAAVSNLGRLPIDRFAGGGFRARAGFFVPPGQPSTALFVTLSGGPDGVEVVGAMPEALASAGRLDAVLAEIAAAIARPG